MTDEAQPSMSRDQLRELRDYERMSGVKGMRSSSPSTTSNHHDASSSRTLLGAAEGDRLSQRERRYNHQKQLLSKARSHEVSSLRGSRRVHGAFDVPCAGPRDPGHWSNETFRRKHPLHHPTPTNHPSPKFMVLTSIELPEGADRTYAVPTPAERRKSRSPSPALGWQKSQSAPVSFSSSHNPPRTPGPGAYNIPSCFGSR